MRQLDGTDTMPVKGPTLTEWRKDYSISPEERWFPYRSFFEQHGYTLWIKSDFYVNGILSGFEPPNDRPRAPDGFSYTCEANLSRLPGYIPQRMTQFPARTSDDRDVLIVVLSDGEHGANGVEALRHVAMGPLARVDRNHALPALQILQCGHYVFGVFPLVGLQFERPWFPSMAEALHGMCQVLEGVVFLHDHLIAHRDLFTDNFLHSGPRRGQWPTDDATLPRYYIIDFVTAVRFPHDSDPSSRTVVGLPWLDAEDYNRRIPPEMLTGKPYCPFKTDVWQLGKTFLIIFQHLQNISEILDVLYSMVADDPETRPTAQEALRSFLNARRSIPTYIMTELIREPEYVFSDSEDEGEGEGGAPIGKEA